MPQSGTDLSEGGCGHQGGYSMGSSLPHRGLCLPPAEPCPWLTRQSVGRRDTRAHGLQAAIHDVHQVYRGLGLALPAPDVCTVLTLDTH